MKLGALFVHLKTDEPVKVYPSPVHNTGALREEQCLRSLLVSCQRTGDIFSRQLEKVG